MLCCKDINIHLMAFTAITLFGFISAQAVGSKDLLRCRQSCYQKFVQDWHHCMDFEDCKNMCITPPNINSYIPEAFSFLCWNNCDQQLGPFPLHINSVLRQGSLVITDITWDQAITNASKQCLVTWEVSGGGLMGNLLTDSSTVELSLWSETIYHVQVTCKHKETGGMRRSFKLIVDTHGSSTSAQAIAIDPTFSNKKSLHIYSTVESMPTSSDETDSRLRILKDSSKDFLAPYNPNINTKTPSSSSSSSTSVNKFSTHNSAEDEITSSLSVTRTKLLDLSTSNESTSFLTQSMIFAVVGSIILFLAIIILYLIMRPTRKHISVADKQVLIRTEVLPSQVPLNPASSFSATKTKLNDQHSTTLHV